MEIVQKQGQEHLQLWENHLQEHVPKYQYFSPLLIYYNFSRFVTISPITPVEPLLLAPVAPLPLSGLLVPHTTPTKIITEGKHSLYMREILSSMILSPLSPPPPPACTMQATSPTSRTSSRPWCRTGGPGSRWRTQVLAMTLLSRWQKLN